MVIVSQFFFIIFLFFFFFIVCVFFFFFFFYVACFVFIVSLSWFFSSTSSSSSSSSSSSTMARFQEDREREVMRTLHVVYEGRQGRERSSPGKGQNESRGLRRVTNHQANPRRHNL